MPQTAPSSSPPRAVCPGAPGPYHAIAEQTGLSVEEVMARLPGHAGGGVIRRIGAVPNHYAIGWTANRMTVWDVVDERIDALGSQVGGAGVRDPLLPPPRALPTWPYNLFAHGPRQQPGGGPPRRKTSGPCSATPPAAATCSSRPASSEKSGLRI